MCLYYYFYILIEIEMEGGGRGECFWRQAALYQVERGKVILRAMIHIHII